MPPSCALLGGFAIGARVALLWQQREREMSASACTRSVPGCYFYSHMYSEISSSKIIYFQSYFPDTQTDTRRTDFSTWATRWSVKIILRAEKRLRSL